MCEFEARLMEWHRLHAELARAESQERTRREAGDDTAAASGRVERLRRQEELAMRALHAAAVRLRAARGQAAA